MRATSRIPTMIFSEHRLEPGERLTLALMYSLARTDTLTVWRTTAELADLSGYTERGLLKHVTKLRGLGFIADAEQSDPRGGDVFRGFRLLHDYRGEPVGAGA